MIGRSLRQYVITARLGAGGMGEVWLAHDQTLDRDVALKVMPPGDADAATRRERFLREAKAASALNHPNIITIYEINSDQGIDFIAMEYVRGGTLGDVLKQGALPIDAVYQLGGQIAEAVGRAHRAGIVHRDLKPGNIMVTEDGLLKVLDFGLAKVSRTPAAGAETAATQAMLTRAGSTVGTLGYMSPEQAIGDQVDARSDVFSFGVILYEMLSGRLPFSGKTLSEVLRELHFEEPPAIESLRRDVPQGLRDLLSRALEKKPSDRFANLSEVALALGGAPSPSAVTKEFPASARAAVAAPGRWWLRLAAIGAIVVTVVAAAMGVRAYWADSSGANGGANAIAGADLYEMTTTVAALLARHDRPENADKAIALLEQMLAANPQSAIAHAHLATAYLRKSQATRDQQWRRLAGESARRAVDLNPDLAAARLAMGFVSLDAGDRTAAAEAFRRAADLDPMNPYPHMGQGLIDVAEQRPEEAEAAWRRAVGLGPQEWRIQSEYASHLYRRSQYAEAARYWEQALKLTPDNTIVLRAMSGAYFMLDRTNEAASSLQRALEIRPVAAVYTNLGTIRFYQGRYADAVLAFEKAVELDANASIYWGNLGDGLRWAPGRRPEAAAAYRRAIDLIEQDRSRKPGDGDLDSRMALYLVKLGNREAALKAADAVVNRKDVSAQMLYRLAVVYELAGDRDRGLAALGRALATGYPVKDLPGEPELTAVRADARYHRLLESVATEKARQ